MLLANTYTENMVLCPTPELTLHRLRAFRAEVGLALAAADSVTVDLRAVKRIDSWALLAVIDLAITFSPRLTFIAPDYLCNALLHIEPRTDLSGQIMSA